MRHPTRAAQIRLKPTSPTGSTRLRIWRLGLDSLAARTTPQVSGLGLFADLEQLVAAHDAVLLGPDRADAPRRVGSLGRWRQWIESTFDTPKDQLGLERHGGRTLPGVVVRVAQRLALAAAIWWNWEIGAPDKRSLVAYDYWDLIHLLADQFGEMEGVTRVDMRAGRPCCSRCDAADGAAAGGLGAARTLPRGEDEPPVAFDWPWPAVRATAVDALGQAPLRRGPPAAPSIAASR